MSANSSEFDAARAVLREGLDIRAFPAAAVSVGHVNGPVWEESFGTLTYEAGAPRCTGATVFDLASLTKVIATASVAMRHVASASISLDTRVSDVLPSFRSAPAAAVNVRQLLDHSSGLPAHLRIWEQAHGRADYLPRLATTGLEREPGRAAVYSDTGFILLGFMLEDAGGAPLDQQFSQCAGPLATDLRFLPPAAWRDRTAPTELDSWRGRVLIGEVHDENAAALGGVASHAGLFGTAAAVGAFARVVLQTFARETHLGTPESMKLFASRSAVPGSSRALAWDTGLPTSSCGTRMSPRAIGHTGFTGTSLWIDPARDLYAVLLTNRVHPTRTNVKFLPLRARFHDALPF
ncbi:MAG TPA: serine hydrolase domain-containing protein [Vicinamibacterales bacterium]|nr:serine hydrolase domain-containing protein [Vicinamibacterales bacterium]